MNYPAPIAHCPHCRIPLVQEYKSLAHCPRCTWFMSIRTPPAEQSDQGGDHTVKQDA